MQVVSPGGIIGPTLNNQKHSFTLDNTHHSLKRNETNSFTMLLSQNATKPTSYGKKAVQRNKQCQTKQYYYSSDMVILLDSFECQHR